MIQSGDRMKWKEEWKKLAILVIAFLACFYLPVEYLQGWTRLKNAVWESLCLARWYAQEHRGGRQGAGN